MTRRQRRLVAGLLTLTLWLGFSGSTSAQQRRAYNRVISVVEDASGSSISVNTDSKRPPAAPSIQYLPGPDGTTILAADFQGLVLSQPPTLINPAAGISQIRVGQLQANPPICRIAIATTQPALLRSLCFRARAGTLIVKWSARPAGSAMTPGRTALFSPPEGRPSIPRPATGSEPGSVTPSTLLAVTPHPAIRPQANAQTQSALFPQAAPPIAPRPKDNEEQAGTALRVATRSGRDEVKSRSGSQALTSGANPTTVERDLVVQRLEVTPQTPWQSTPAAARPSYLAGAPALLKKAPTTPQPWQQSPAMSTSLNTQEAPSPIAQFGPAVGKLPEPASAASKAALSSRLRPDNDQNQEKQALSGQPKKSVELPPVAPAYGAWLPKPLANLAGSSSPGFLAGVNSSAKAQPAATAKPNQINEIRSMSVSAGEEAAVSPSQGEEARQTTATPTVSDQGPALPSLTISGAGPVRIQLLSPGPISFHSFRLHNPERYVIDLDGVPELVHAQMPTAEENQFLRSLRVGNPDGDEKISRLVLDLQGPDTEVTEAMSASRCALYVTLDKPLSALGTDEIKPGMTVMLDAGHGGSDPGAQRGDIQEKEITLAIVEKLKSLLEQKRLKVVLTRADDAFVSLEDRVGMTNSLAPDAFLSVHINSLETNSTIHGIETYFQTEQSKELARSIHDSLVSRLSAPDRSIRKARFYVINHTAHPAVLAEVGFISNKEERAKLISSDYQEQVADALARGVILYLSKRPELAKAGVGQGKAGATDGQVGDEKKEPGKSASLAQLGSGRPGAER